MSGPSRIESNPKGSVCRAAGSRGRRRHWLVLAVLIAVPCAMFAMGGHEFLTLKTIGLNYEDYELLLPLIDKDIPAAAIEAIGDRQPRQAIVIQVDHTRRSCFKPLHPLKQFWPKSIAACLCD